RLDPRSEARIPALARADAQIIVMCSEGYASTLAAATLRRIGVHEATDLDGGFQAWKAAGLPTRPAQALGGHKAGRQLSPTWMLFMTAANPGEHGTTRGTPPDPRRPVPPGATMAPEPQAARPHRAVNPDEKSTAEGQPSEAHGHQHRDVSGGWLRPAVFGAMDGLVTNVSLIAGVGGGGGSQQFIVLTGLAG